MNGISAALRFLIDIKWKILFGLLCFVFFLLALFPFSDLADLATSKVAELTRNQIFLRFNKLGISLIPLPGLQMGDVAVDTPFTGTISANQFTISPSLSALFSSVPYGTLQALGLAGGDLEVSLKSGAKSETGTERQRIEIHATQLSLAELREIGDLPVLMKGRLDLEAKVLADLSFSEQPEADIVVQADKFELPSQVLNTLMGPLNIPGVNLSSVSLKGKLAGGNFTIEEGKVGSDNDEVKGKVSGRFSVVLQKDKMGVRPQLGPYSLDLDLTIKAGLEDKLSLFLVAVSQFKTAVGDSSRYRIHLEAQNPNFPPNFSGLQ